HASVLHADLRDASQAAPDARNAREGDRARRRRILTARRFAPSRASIRWAGDVSSSVVRQDGSSLSGSAVTVGGPSRESRRSRLRKRSSIAPALLVATACLLAPLLSDQSSAAAPGKDGKKAA